MIKKLWKKFIAKQYEYWFKEEEPKRLNEITYSELSKLLTKKCRCQIFLSDEIYGLTSKEEAIKYSNQTTIRFRKWIKEKHDCDEFSFALMGYWNKGLEQFAFGIAWSKYHAFNIMIDHKKQIWIVEPQNNRFYKLENIKKNKFYWPLRLILI